MPTMRSEDKVLAIFLADIHLSLKPPIWRSAEEDWLEAQARVLREVSTLQKLYGCPVICAGDIFDRNKKIADGWNAPAELINFAIDKLPDDMLTIPGQHDLPNHQYSDIDRSAYWTLCKAGKIKHLVPGVINSYLVYGVTLNLFAFPSGYSLKCRESAVRKNQISIAVAHDYIWIPGHSYSGAPEKKRFGKRIAGVKDNKWLGYDIVVYGDNHKGFVHKIENTIIFNCGTLMRRKSDEIDYKPQVGLLLEGGKVVSHYLDTSQDKYIEKEQEKVEANLDMGGFLDELEKLGNTALDFVEVAKEFLHSGKITAEATQIFLNAMEKRNAKN